MDSQQAQAMHTMAVMLPMFFFFGLIMMALIIVPLWKICLKAGLSGPLSLLAIIPGVGMLIALYIIAFSEWRGVAPTAAYQATYPPAPYPPAGYPPQTPGV